MGAGSTPAGWYPDVERPGGERYWDGWLWTDERRSASGAASSFPSAQPESPPSVPGLQPGGFGHPASGFDQQIPTYGGQQPPAYGAAPGGAYGQQPAYGSPPGYTPYGAVGPSHPRSSAPGWALGLSISGLVLTFCCFGFVLSIPGTIMGWTSMKAIDRGEQDPSQRGMAKAAFIVGLIGLSLFALAILYYVVVIAASA
ncbi:MAG: DUF2510 domain-containing protein [Ilumatobacter sp.]|uniref:DUF4190 domain-containing protein n=1 Tax=Ilumatobacter sp. TaxID=1967498 RepID=UPI003298CE8B